VNLKGQRVVAYYDTIATFYCRNYGNLRKSQSAYSRF